MMVMMVVMAMVVEGEEVRLFLRINHLEIML